MVKAYGRMLFWEGASLWILSTARGESYPRTDRHAHHALQVSLALKGRIEIEGRDETVAGAGAAVASDVEHAFVGEGTVAQLFIDPDGRAGRAVARRLFARSTVVAVTDAAVHELARNLLARRSKEALKDIGKSIVATLAGDEDAIDVHDVRVQRIIAWASSQRDGRMSLADASATFGLSPGRIRHLFVAETGMPFRTFQLWRRLQGAVEQVAIGASLTDAAHVAGFSDAAHFSRTFRRMFGITADSLRVS